MGTGKSIKYGYDRRGKRFLAICLLTVIVTGSVSGCGGGNVASNDGVGTISSDNGADQAVQNGQDGQPWAEGTPMGRYVEETVQLPDGVSLSVSGTSLHKLEDGSLILVDAGSSMLASKNNGKDWRESQKGWFKRIKEHKDYIMSADIGKNGATAVVWEEAMSDEELEKAEEAMRHSMITLDPELLVVRPDGTEMTAKVELTEEDVWMTSAYVSDTGRIFACGFGSNIYEVKEDGSSELFLSVDDGHPDLIQVHDNMMFMDGTGYDSLLIYDMDAKEYVEDEVLADFIQENYSSRGGYAGEYWDMFFMPDDDGVIYIAGKKGLYRHVLGGSVMEQVIDGSLSTFGNPSYSVVDMEMLDDNGFLVLFSGGKLVRFIYNPDIPTVPVGKVKVYSLQENATVRQTLSQYQTANPTMYVEYEVGMGDGSSVTREDALKSLNTRIMAGEGPDVLILDNMPVDSYIEKGMLKDISPLLEEMNGEDGLFMNMVDAFRRDGHIYEVPCEVQMPFILGKSQDVAQMENLKEIADTMEKVQSDNPGSNLIEIVTEKGVMRMFSMVSAPAWMTEQGGVNTEAVTEFLMQTKRIYDAQMEGVSEKDIEAWQDSSDYYMEVMGVPIEDTDYIRMYTGEAYFMGGLRKFAMGSLLDEMEYAKQISIVTSEGFEDCEIKSMKGQCDDVFWARTLMGINAASENAALAEDFLRTALSTENQMNVQGGMAINKAALYAGFEQRKQQSNDNIYGVNTWSNADGLYVYLEIRVPEDEEVEALVGWMESAETAYVEDDTFEEVVYEEGIHYMQGTKSLTEAVEMIEKKLAIYLAE